MPCNLKTFRHWETCSESDEIRKSKHACVVGAHESTRKRSVRTLPKDLEDHIAETVFNSLNHCNLVHTFIPVPPAVKNSGCKNSSGQRMGKAQTVAGLANDESQEQKGGHPRSTKKEQRTVHFGTSMDICHPKHADTKRRVVIRGDTVNDDSGAVITEQGSSASQMTAANVD